jgi:hypothetical protein
MVWMIRKPWGHTLRLLLYLHKGVALPHLQQSRCLPHRQLGLTY